MWALRFERSANDFEQRLQLKGRSPVIKPGENLHSNVFLF